jgi:hypothetical protein
MKLICRNKLVVINYKCKVTASYDTANNTMTTYIPEALLNQQCSPQCPYASDQLGSVLFGRML